ncbi:MAG: hypothetical protein J2P37_20285, partial [Ktedonobacteraceae bacterium]|nr:hypothetical protein [Ktedonobacteraceae bacterium]
RKNHKEMEEDLESKGGDDDHCGVEEETFAKNGQESGYGHGSAHSSIRPRPDEEDRPVEGIWCPTACEGECVSTPEVKGQSQDE